MTKKVALIIGSNRPHRIGKVIATWAQAILNQGLVQYDVLDLKDINLPFLDESEIPRAQNYTQAHTYQWSQKIQSYDGVIFLFPQYNWGYPAVLKNAIDYLALEWKGKPVSCITYGSHGGNQAFASMLLVINGLKMRRLAVNPAIEIKNDMFNNYHFKNINTALQPFQGDIELLGHNFNQVLLE